MERNELRNDVIVNMIYRVRGKKVMIDSDLAVLYGVDTKVLIQSVKRNLIRFPEDFMFQLNAEENNYLRSHSVTSNKRGGRRYLPYVFTEQGVAMLSGVLNSERAIEVNIAIMRTFSKLREMIYSHKDLKRKIEEMEKKYDGQFRVVFDALKQLLSKPAVEKAKIGFHSSRT